MVNRSALGCLTLNACCWWWWWWWCSDRTCIEESDQSSDRVTTEVCHKLIRRMFFILLFTLLFLALNHKKSNEISVFPISLSFVRCFSLSPVLPASLAECSADLMIECFLFCVCVCVIRLSVCSRFVLLYDSFPVLVFGTSALSLSCFFSFLFHTRDISFTDMFCGSPLSVAVALFPTSYSVLFLPSIDSVACIQRISTHSTRSKLVTFPVQQRA